MPKLDCTQGPFARWRAAQLSPQPTSQLRGAATQGRALLAMRYEGVLPGAATTALAQHISSLAAVERSVSEIGAALERRGAVRFRWCPSD